jgi:hypothetical protein
MEDNIKMDLKSLECVDTDQIQIAQDKFQWQTLANMVINIWIP